MNKCTKICLFYDKVKNKGNCSGYRFVDIPRKSFQFEFFNENETERMLGCFGATWVVKKLNFLGESPGVA